MPLPPGPKLPTLVQTYLSFRHAGRFGDFCRRRYGPAFTLKVLPFGTTVAVTDPEAIKAVFTAPPATWAGDGFKLVERVFGAGSLVVSDEPGHMNARKKLLPHFGREARERYPRMIEEITRKEIARWPTGTPFPLQPAMDSIALDVILQAIIGVRDPARAKEMHEVVVQAIELKPIIVLSWLKPSLERFGPWRRHADGVRRTRELFREEIHQRRADIARGEPGDDILTHLVATDAFEEAELVDQLVTLLMAGHETTASALAWTFERLLRHPNDLARAKSDDAYLEAAIKEALRLRPVIPGVPRRLRAAAEFAGYELPAGTTVMVAARVTHVSPEIYDEPLRFRPERFLDGNSHTYDWMPFGGGGRRCLAASFAMFEMQKIVRTVLENTEIRPDRQADEPVRSKHLGYVPGRGARVVQIAPS